MLAAAVVLAPGALAALWPVLLVVAGALVVRLYEALPIPALLTLAPLTCLSALMAPLAVGLGLLAPMARARGLPGRHERHAGSSALVGYVVGTLGLLVYVVQLVRCC